MKKLFFSMLVVIVALTSCNKQDKQEKLPNNATETLTFNLSIAEDVESETKTGSVTPVAPTRYIMEVWSEDGTTAVNCFEGNTANKGVRNNGSFTVALDNNESYICLFWADNGTTTDNSGTYDATNLRAVKLNSGKVMTGDAYFGKLSMAPNSENTQNISLSRALAKINYVETEGYIEPVNNLFVSYQNYSFNLYDGTTTKVAGETVSREYSNVAHLGGVIATDYIFAPATSDSELIDIEVNINTEPKRVINNVPVRANYKTNLSGEYNPKNVEVFDFDITHNSSWSTPDVDEDAEIKERYKIGDSYPDATNPVGVVWFIETPDAEGYGIDGKIISLNDSITGWSQLSTTTGATDINDGNVNQATIRALIGTAVPSENPATGTYAWTHFPAFKFCEDKNADGVTGWYLPAVNELNKKNESHVNYDYQDPNSLNEIYDHKATLNTTLATLTEHGAKQLPPSLHWSSFEYSSANSWYVGMGNGITGYNTKSTSNMYVRCVREF